MKDRIVRKIYQSKDINDLQDKINMLGSNVKFSTLTFMNIRIISSIVLAFFLTIFTDLGYIIVPIIVLSYYHLFYYYLITKPIRLRMEKLDKEALSFFEILTITLESGKNLEQAIETTCFNVQSELSDEFKKCLLEIKFGKSMIEALNDMKVRIPSETINNIILNITQTNMFGNSILDTMNNQIDFLREKQILEIKEQINKIPNKISIISVLFIVPLILLIILGPFVITYIG